MWNTGEIIEVDIDFNNSGERSVCPLCQGYFKSHIGYVVNLTGSWATLCDECVDSFKSDYNFKIIKFNKAEPEVVKLFSLVEPKLYTCARCGRSCFTLFGGLCWFCDEDLDVQFGKDYITTPGD
jgi:hypothetical protein